MNQIRRESDGIRNIQTKGMFCTKQINHLLFFCQQHTRIIDTSENVPYKQIIEVCDILQFVVSFRMSWQSLSVSNFNIIPWLKWFKCVAVSTHPYSEFVNCLSNVFHITLFARGNIYDAFRLTISAMNLMSDVVLHDEILPRHKRTHCTFPPTFDFTWFSTGLGDIRLVLRCMGKCPPLEQQILDVWWPSRYYFHNLWCLLVLLPGWWVLKRSIHLSWEVLDGIVRCVVPYPSWKRKRGYRVPILSSRKLATRDWKVATGPRFEGFIREELPEGQAGLRLHNGSERNNPPPCHLVREFPQRGRQAE